MIAIAMMAISTVVISCGDDDDLTPSSNKGAKFTRVVACVTASLLDVYDFSFTMDGKNIEMSKETKNNIAILYYMDDENHKDAKIEATVTLKEGYDVSKLGDHIDVGTYSIYETGTQKITSVTSLASSSNMTFNDVYFDAVIESGFAKDKKSAVEYIATMISSSLSGTVEGK